MYIVSVGLIPLKAQAHRHQGTVLSNLLCAELLLSVSVSLFLLKVLQVDMKKTACFFAGGIS